MPLTGDNMHKDMQVDLTLANARVRNLKQVYELLSMAIAERTNIPQITLFDRLMDRENMASSGIGDGVAIPHLRFRRLHKPFTALMSLEKPIEFHAIDSKPVDLVCLVMSPEAEGALHLRRLSRITRHLRREEICERLREAKDVEIMRSVMMDPDGWLIAA